MTYSGDRFPFGAQSTPRRSRWPEGRDVRVAVVGVYPSALHVRWDLPSWAVERLGLAPRVGALAVDVEPRVFWDGSNPQPGGLVQRWQREVGFEPGDGSGRHGHVAPQMNGTSGRAVTDRVLEPLEVAPEETFFTDVVPRFFVKFGAPTRPQQADRIQGVYEPFARAAGLPPASLPARPTPARLVTAAIGEEGGRLRRELADANAPTVVTLGEEARAVVQRIVDEATGAPLTPLRRAATEYGEAGALRVGGYRARWYALTHPGNRNPAWALLHEQWMRRSGRHGGR